MGSMILLTVLFLGILVYFKLTAKIYVVTMYRYGDKNRYSYVLGAYTNRQKAFEDAIAEQKAKGGEGYDYNYYPEILAFKINSPDTDGTVEVEYALRRNKKYLTRAEVYQRKVEKIRAARRNKINQDNVVTVPEVVGAIVGNGGEAI